jgi:hypothetical protein
MSFHNRIVLPIVAVLSLAFLAACGSSSHHVTPPPSGAFSNANLSGTYVFSLTGTESVGGDFLSITGSFAACGCTGGTISGGAIDFNDSDTSVVGSSFPNTSVTGGNYSVTSDGRGKAVLNTTTPWGASTFTVDFVLASSSGASSTGLITQFDANGSGSGTLALQSAASQPAAATYVLSLSGINGTGETAGTIAGAVAVDGSGNITGTLDFNQATNPATCTINSGSVITVSGTPGTATLVTSCDTFHFDVYAVSANDYKLIETDQFPNFSGDLFLQTATTIPSGQIVFSLGGPGVVINGVTVITDPVAIAGLVTADTTGATLSSGEEDFNDNGTASLTSSSSSAQAISVQITPPSVGSSRYLFAFTNFENGQGQLAAYTFAVYPYSNTAAVMVEVDSNGVSAGTAYTQSSTALAAAQGYGMDLSGFNFNSGVEEDDIAEFTTTTTGLSGAIDMNDLGTTPLFDKNYTGTYGGLDATATGRGLITSTTPDQDNPTPDLVYYTVSSTQTVMIEVDPNQLALGSLIQQSGTGSASDLAERHLALSRVSGKAAMVAKGKRIILRK